MDLSSLIVPVINIGSIITVALGFCKYYVLSKGASRLRKVYWLQICIGILGIITNTLIVVRYPSVWGALAFLPLILWAILMSIKGLLYADVSIGKHLDKSIVSDR